jgi:pyocin large subunit-like protein
VFVAATIALLGGALIASAQVSSGSPEAAQQNFAKKPTDNAAKPTDNAVKPTDNAVQNDRRNATANRPQVTHKSDR